MKEKCAFDLYPAKCTALTSKNCENCPFRKSSEELAAGRRKARRRLYSLLDEAKTRIVEKYYTQNRPY